MFSSVQSASYRFLLLVFVLSELSQSTIGFAVLEKSLVCTNSINIPRRTLKVAGNKYHRSMSDLNLDLSPIHRNSHFVVDPAASISLTESHYLVRIVFLRALAFVQGIAFLVAWKQNKALIGDGGITPARYILNEAQERARIKRERRVRWLKDFASTTAVSDTEYGRWWHIISANKLRRSLSRAINRNIIFQNFREVLWDRTDRMGRPVTTLLWLAKDRHNLNTWFDGIALAGLAISLTILLLGAANVPLMMGMWLCQRSLMAVGGPWYGYGWEPQLAELNFHALFMVPLFSLNSVPALPVPAIVNWMLRWHLFRVMMGAGLIKLKSGDRKWKDLTAMNYFYQTQPVPNPVTRFFHFLPTWWHKFEVLINHFVELICPAFLILPLISIKLRRAAGLLQMMFQCVLISTGNLSFLNWLTMVPAICCFDDAFLSGLFSPSRVEAISFASGQYQLSMGRKIVSTFFGLLIANLSIPVVRNLISKRQIMNGSFDPLRLVNTYGAFGTVNEDRDEFIIEAAANVDGPWKEYEFKVKPGNPMRRPRFLSPYHHRLDWQMWIAATVRSIERSPWIFKFLIKLLERDDAVLKLLDHDPWKDEALKPKYIRVNRYRYRFCHTTDIRGRKPFWERDLLGAVYPRRGVASIDDLKDEIMARQPNRPL